MTIVTDERCTGYRALGHPEKPARVARTLDLLRSQRSLPLAWAGPADVSDAQLLRAHTASHLGRLAVAGDFDADTPWYEGIGDHARRAVGGGLRALDLALGGEPAFSLLRPPGHHAERDRIMGFCYLGSMAVAALEAVSRGVGTVAVLDFDVHHGNGTEDILRGVPGVVFASVHQHPCYPGTGAADSGGNCFNFPVAPGIPRGEYRDALSRAIARLRSVRPAVLGVSAGFDAYSKDPLASGTLEREDFHWLGAEVRSFGIPTFGLLEGGYSLDLPDLVFHFLLGWAGIRP